MVVEDLNEFIMPRGKANVLACTQIGGHEVVGISIPARPGRPTVAVAQT